MKEYGEKKSWTSLFTIKNLDISAWYQFSVLFFVTKKREIALMRYYYDEKLVVYNLKNENIREITTTVFGMAVNYIESLISPKEYC